jgi:hypothetical protein
MRGAEDALESWAGGAFTEGLQQGHG